jgi:hypothetical protein
MVCEHKDAIFIPEMHLVGCQLFVDCLIRVVTIAGQEMFAFDTK